MVNKFNLLHTVLYNSYTQDVKMQKPEKKENFRFFYKRLASEGKSGIMKNRKAVSSRKQEDSNDNLKSYFSEDKDSV